MRQIKPRGGRDPWHGDARGWPDRRSTSGAGTVSLRPLAVVRLIRALLASYDSLLDPAVHTPSRLRHQGQGAATEDLRPGAAISLAMPTEKVTASGERNEARAG
jgi:hypothetical protein